jgi:phosphoribosyl-AMP cyclohydrolase
MAMVDKHMQLMMSKVAISNSPEDLRKIITNAANNGATELVRAAKLRLYAILPKEEPGTLEYAVWQSIYALEETLKEERGKTVMLSRTRQKIGRQGEQKCVADLIVGAPSDGFRMLADRDMLHLTFEAIALNFPDLFPDDVLAAAKARLAEAGYAVP